jgi:hypothetical protein
MIFRDGGAQLVLPVVEDDSGYAVTYRIAMRRGEPALAPFGRGGRRR